MTDTGSPHGDELQALQEQLAEARAEVERLQAGTADAEARATTAAAETANLQNELRSLQESQASAEARLRTAAEKYRDLVVRTEPTLPPELIAGDDIDAVDASVAAARNIVGRVRTHIETEAHAGRIPAGSPPRTAPDYSALSPEQKIRLGLAQRAS